VRRRRTRTQTKLDIKGKTANVAGAFAARTPQTSGTTSNKPKIQHILLIDDVFTTGATLYACFTAQRAVFPPSVRISVATLAFVGEA
jgi:predicted amidophosphoribosyltransferase